MADETVNQDGGGKQAHTPGPWEWMIHDWSMASLEGPEMMVDTVMSVSPCGACQERAKESGQWKWGRCSVPKKADAYLIAAAPDLAAVARAYEAWEADLILNADWPNELPRMTQAQYDRLLEIQAMRNAALRKSECQSNV